MAIIGFELITVEGDLVTADLIVWHRYRQWAPGIVETFIDANPQLAFIHRTTPFIPPGTMLRLPIDPDLMLGQLPSNQFSNLWTDKRGYTI